MPSVNLNPSDDIFTVIKSLLESRANSTLSELLVDYDEKVCDGRLPRNFKDLRRLMQSIPEVECITNDYGLEMWQIRKVKRKPEYLYMKRAKPRGSSRDRNSMKKRSRGSTTSSQGSSFSTAQPQPKRQRHQNANDVNHNLSKRHRTVDMDGYLHNYQLMGDDFMLSMAKIDLGYKMTKDPESAILRIGYCISGVTIKELARLVRSSATIDSRVIVYVGSVDILQGRHLDSIVHDYFDLVSAFRERGIEPILCNLAPFGQTEESNNYDGVINGFNCWLNNRKWNVIDVNSCFLDEKGKTIRSIYQKDPRNVSGCNIRHLLWNKLGRQRVMKRLKRALLGNFKL